MQSSVTKGWLRLIHVVDELSFALTMDAYVGRASDWLQELRARDAAALHEYAWVDRDAGVVRIPIERAIAVLAERGLPGRPVAPKAHP